MNLPDYHLHTYRCGHAQGGMQEYVAVAQRRGLKEIGFSDHLPLLHTRDKTLTMDWDDFPFYLADVESFQANSSITIKLGVEADWVSSKKSELEQILENYEFDYVLGSVHFVDGWGIDDSRYISNYDNYSIDDLYKRYFDEIKSAASSGLFDIIAHPDLIKKFNFKPKNQIDDLYFETARTIADYNLTIEVSSAGLRKPVKEIYPSRRFLEICYDLDISITTGSDAHKPGEVGSNFFELYELITSVGYRQIATFRAREREMIEIA
jgi:histidinol-phosphatase (PHP family)